MLHFSIILCLTNIRSLYLLYPGIAVFSGMELCVHIRDAVSNSGSQVEIGETILQAEFYCGIDINGH